MDNWLVEKSGFAVEGLAELVDLIQKYEHLLPEEFLTRAQSSLSYSLHYATLVFASSRKSPYSPEDSKLIFQNGSSGYKAISGKYHQGKTAYITDISYLKKNLTELLNEDIPNRSEVHQILRLCVIRNPVVEELKDLSENVVMGDMPWLDFVQKARNLLVDLQ